MVRVCWSWSHAACLSALTQGQKVIVSSPQDSLGMKRRPHGYACMSLAVQTSVFGVSLAPIRWLDPEALTWIWIRLGGCRLTDGSSYCDWIGVGCCFAGAGMHTVPSFTLILGHACLVHALMHASWAAEWTKGLQPQQTSKSRAMSVSDLARSSMKLPTACHRQKPHRHMPHTIERACHAQVAVQHGQAPTLISKASNLRVQRLC